MFMPIIVNRFVNSQPNDAIQTTTDLRKNWKFIKRSIKMKMITSDSYNSDISQILDNLQCALKLKQNSDEGKLYYSDVFDFLLIFLI